MKAILLWDPRFPDRAPARLLVDDSVASAAVRAGVAAAANPEQAGELSAGGALDPATLTEVVLQIGTTGRTRRVALPFSVVQIGVAAGVVAAVGSPVASVVLPALTLTGPLTFAANAADGTLVANIGNVPAGVTPTVTPGDGRLLIAGSAGSWKIVKGMSASSAGPLNFTVNASGAQPASAMATVTAALATALTTVPQPGARIAHWKASDIALADGASIPVWTDSISGLAATATGTQPIFKTNVAGGQPAVRCNGTNRLIIGRPAALTGPLADGGTWSVVMIFKNAVGASGNYPTIFGDAFGSIFFGASAAEMQSNVARKAYPTQAQVNTLIYSGDGGAAKGRVFANGTMYNQGTNVKISASGDLAICNAGSGNYGFNGDLLEVIIYNTGISAPEALQAHQYGCAGYGQALPHANLNRFPVCDGDSQTYGTGAGAETSYPVKLAALKGWPLGAFANVGKPSASLAPGSGAGNNMSDRAARDVDGYRLVTGLPVTLIWFEYYNRAGTGLQLYNESAAYNAARRAADPNIRIITGTSLSSYNRDTTNRTDYNNMMVASLAGADVVVPLHTNANVGVDGAAGTTTAASAKFADGYHPNPSGYDDVAGMFAPTV